MDTPSCRNMVLPANVKSSLDCTWNKWLSSSLSSTRTHSAPNHSAPTEKILGPYNLKTKPWRISPGRMFPWLKSQVMRADYLCPSLQTYTSLVHRTALGTTSQRVYHLWHFRQHNEKQSIKKSFQQQASFAEWISIF